MNVKCSDAIDYHGDINNKFHFKYMNSGKNSILVYPYRFIDWKLTEELEVGSNTDYNG